MPLFYCMKRPFNISYTTLKDCVEQHVASWVTELAKLKNPPSHNQAREIVIKILQIQSEKKKKPLNSHWNRRFLKRYSLMQKTMASILNSIRVDGPIFGVKDKFYRAFNGA